MMRLLASVAVAAGLLALAPGVAHADANQLFLNCLNHNGVIVNPSEEGAFLNLMGAAQNDVNRGMNPDQIVYNLVAYHNVPENFAKIDVACVIATTAVMGG
jgi:hypothetical protein